MPGTYYHSLGLHGCARIVVIRVQLYHGEVHTIKRFYEIPSQQRPPPKDCIFLTTHEPCSLCLRYAVHRVCLSSHRLIRPLAPSPGPDSITFTISSHTKTPATCLAFHTTSKSHRRYSRHLQREKHLRLGRRARCITTITSSSWQLRWQAWWKRLETRRTKLHSQRRLRTSKGNMLLYQTTIRSERVQPMPSHSSSKPLPLSVCTELFV